MARPWCGHDTAMAWPVSRGAPAATSLCGQCGIRMARKFFWGKSRVRRRPLLSHDRIMLWENLADCARKIHFSRPVSLTRNVISGLPKAAGSHHQDAKRRRMAPGIFSYTYRTNSPDWSGPGDLQHARRQFPVLKKADPEESGSAEYASDLS